MTKTYRFYADLACYLANGEMEVVRDFEVPIDAANERDARSYLREIATEMVHDEGSNLLDAPLDYLEVIRVKRDQP